MNWTLPSCLSLYFQPALGGITEDSFHKPLALTPRSARWSALISLAIGEPSLEGGGDVPCVTDSLIMICTYWYWIVCGGNANTGYTSRKFKH